MTKHLWNWEGDYFGYIEGDQLRTHEGYHVGKINKNNEIFGSDGMYLGEIMNDNRLITKESKINNKEKSFIPKMKKIGKIKKMEKIGKIMKVGYTDFPKPNKFIN
ncbi:hypothetical protein [Jeotgalicoccus marinus]|uniref:hypothetical protein n=1 Tax=Jeotgalicoccus marinus TaxID=516700 RepID=UPI0004146791|nr:hypothetical protein [Jeotgalicoccus marinus]